MTVDRGEKNSVLVCRGFSAIFWQQPEVRGGSITTSRGCSRGNVSPVAVYLVVLFAPEDVCMGRC